MSFSPLVNRVRASALAAAAALVMTGPLHAEAPPAKLPAPGFYRMMVGDFEVTALNDGTFDMPADKLLQQPPEATEKALGEQFLKVPVETSVNAYLINTGGKLVLIDSGAGVFFGPTLGKLVANLKASGYQPAQIDEILMTHLHVDHVGGAVADGARAFPNAVLRVERADADFWLSDAQMERAPAGMKDFFKGAMAALKPYQAADMLKPFEPGAQLLPGIRAMSTHGHTPGHSSYLVESKGSKLLVMGDLIHVAAVQFPHPEVTIAFDVDPKAAKAMREDVFAQAAKDGTAVAAAHVAFPGMGHLLSEGGGYRWLPLNFTQK